MASVGNKMNAKHRKNSTPVQESFRLKSEVSSSILMSNRNDFKPFSGRTISSNNLKRWIDGTTVTTEIDVAVDDDVVFGFAWNLYNHTFKLLTQLLPSASLRSSRTRKLYNRTFREALGKLFLWGDSFRGGRLEKVLDESDDLKESVVNLLASLGRILISRLVPMCLRDASSLQAKNFQQEARALETLLEQVQFVIEADFESYETSNLDIGKVSPEDALKVIHSVNTDIICLMDLLPSMEATFNSINLPDLEDHTTEPVEFQVSDPAQTYVLNVHDRFRNADFRLVQRLGEANWQRHIALRAISGIEQAKPNSVFLPVSVFHDSGIGSSLPATSSYAVTVASHSSFQSSNADEDTGELRVPCTPKEVSEGKPFTCHICNHLIEHVKNRVDWKRHVFADIKPYICTFSGCADELKAFPTRKLWEEHEFSQHRVHKSWTCAECSFKTSTNAELRSHFVAAHNRIFDDRQYQLVSHMASSRDPEPAQDQKCPLCLTIPGKSKRHFITHVCKHMESIALAALPRQAFGDSETDSSTSVIVDSIDFIASESPTLSALQDSSPQPRTLEPSSSPELSSPAKITSAVDQKPHQGQLDIHLKSNHPSLGSKDVLEKKFKCPIEPCKYHSCGFLSKKDLNRHVRSLHPEVPVRYKCPLEQCNKVFTRPDNVVRHFKMFHKLKDLDTDEYIKMSSAQPETGDGSAVEQVLGRNDQVS